MVKDLYIFCCTVCDKHQIIQFIELGKYLKLCQSRSSGPRDCMHIIPSDTRFDSMHLGTRRIVLGFRRILGGFTKSGYPSPRITTLAHDLYNARRHV